MSVAWMLLIGLIVGMAAKFFMPGRNLGELIVTTLLGIFGSVLTGILGRVAGLYAEGASAGFVIAALGAMLVLGVYRLFLRSHPYG